MNACTAFTYKNLNWMQTYIYEMNRIYSRQSVHEATGFRYARVGRPDGMGRRAFGRGTRGDWLYKSCLPPLGWTRAASTRAEIFIKQSVIDCWTARRTGDGHMVSLCSNKSMGKIIGSSIHKAGEKIDAKDSNQVYSVTQPLRRAKQPHGQVGPRAPFSTPSGGLKRRGLWEGKDRTSHTGLLIVILVKTFFFEIIKNWAWI